MRQRLHKAFHVQSQKKNEWKRLCNTDELFRMYLRWYSMFVHCGIPQFWKLLLETNEVKGGFPKSVDFLYVCTFISYLPPCFGFLDVKSWLVMFGFQLSNIIPGFPRAKMYFVSPPYELTESQACENGQVGRNMKSSFLINLPLSVNRTAGSPVVTVEGQGFISM